MFNFLRRKYEGKIRYNQPVNFLNDLSSRVPLMDYRDFETRKMVDMAYRIITNKPADSSTYKWRNIDYDGTSPKMTITLTSDSQFEICYNHMIAILESPDAFKYWMSFGNGNLHDEKYDFIKRSNEIAREMRGNIPVKFKGNLSGKPPANCPADLEKMNIQQQLEKVLIPSNSGSSQSTASGSQRWSQNDYQYPGAYLAIGLSNGKELKFYPPHVISMCENPDEFNNWLEKGNYDLNNEFFFFISRAKEIEILMKNNRPITVYGRLQEKTRVINCSEELKRLNINSFAETLLLKK